MAEGHDGIWLEDGVPCSDILKLPRFNQRKHRISMYTVSEKGATIFLRLTLPIADRFLNSITDRLRGKFLLE